MTTMPGNPHTHEALGKPGNAIAAVAFELRTANLLKVLEMGLITPESQDAEIGEIAARLGKEAKTADQPTR